MIRRPGRGVVTSVLAASLLLSACASDDPEPDPIEPDPTEETTPPDAPTDEATEPAADEPSPDEPDPADPATIPDDAAAIDLAYVQSVLDELDAALGRAAGLAADAGGEFDEASTAALLSVYTGSAEGDIIDTWQRVVLPALADDPAPPSSEVTELLSVDTACVELVATRDLTPLGVDAADVPADWQIALVPAEGPSDGNETAWQMRVEDGYDPDADPIAYCDAITSE